jgi:hypothetical protein
MSILDTVTPDFIWHHAESGNTDEDDIFDIDGVSASDCPNCENLYSASKVESLLASLTKEHEQRMAEYEEVLTDHRLLVRQLDVSMNGHEGAAAQASLCDIVVMFPAWRDECRKQVLLEAATLADSWGDARKPSNGGDALRNYANELRRMAEGEKE